MPTTSHTVNTTKFPNGSTVYAYDGSNRRDGQAPTGSAITSATAGATSVTFTGLPQDGGLLVAYAVVSSVHTYEYFYDEPYATPSSGGETDPVAGPALTTHETDAAAHTALFATKASTSHHTTHEPGGSDAMAVDAAVGTGSLRTLGTSATAATAGNDSRLTNARTPTAHATTHQPGGSDAMAVDQAAATASLRTLGTGAAQATAGNDSRLSDARTPTAHHTTHEAGGSDVVTIVKANISDLGPPLILGDGSDGALVFDSTSTVAGLVPASGVYTLTRDLHATAITIQTGATVKGNARLFCQGAIQIDAGGTWSCDGGAGNANGTAGAGLTSLSTSQASGGAGNVGAGSAGGTGAMGTAGGAGGANGGTAGGTAGAIAAGWAALQGVFRTPIPALAGAWAWSGTVKGLIGGGGGGGGGGDATNKGGGGGAGGGALFATAKTFVNSGTISAKGGAGGTPTTGIAGGGAGGGGGSVVVYSRSAATMGTITLTGGTGGTAVGGASNGANGSTSTNTLNVVLG